MPIYKDSENGEIADVTSKDLLLALMTRTAVFHFSGAFYRSLVAGLWIDEAVAVGRLAI